MTNDNRIGNQKLELLAVINSKARVFVLASGKIQGEDMAKIFVDVIDSIKKLAAHNPAPFIAKVHKSGNGKI